MSKNTLNYNNTYFKSSTHNMNTLPQPTQPPSSPTTPPTTMPDNIVLASKVANFHKRDYRRYLLHLTEYLDSVIHPSSTDLEATTWKHLKIKGINNSPTWSKLCQILDTPSTTVQSVGKQIQMKLPSTKGKFHHYSPCPHANNFTIEIFDTDPTLPPTDLPTIPRTNIPDDLARNAPASYDVTCSTQKLRQTHKNTPPKSSILNYTIPNNTTPDANTTNISTDSSLPEYIKTEKWETVQSPHTFKQDNTPTKTPTSPKVMNHYDALAEDAENEEDETSAASFTLSDIFSQATTPSTKTPTKNKQTNKPKIRGHS
jgi:hypothetical protein